MTTPQNNSRPLEAFDAEDRTAGSARKRLFIGLITGASGLVLLVLAGLWVVPYVGLRNIHPLAPTLVGAALAALGVLVAWAALSLVLNILLNAIEAAGAIQPGVEPHPAEVRVTVSTPRPAYVRLTVSDTGPGPPPEIASRLFTPFVTGKPDGAGLGLAVAKEVAENHGGRITWHRDDHRTVFVVELPLVSKGNERGETAGR